MNRFLCAALMLLGLMGVAYAETRTPEGIVILDDEFWSNAPEGIHEQGFDAVAEYIRAAILAVPDLNARFYPSPTPAAWNTPEAFILIARGLNTPLGGASPVLGPEFHLPGWSAGMPATLSDVAQEAIVQPESASAEPSVVAEIAPRSRQPIRNSGPWFPGLSSF